MYLELSSHTRALLRLGWIYSRFFVCYYERGCFFNLFFRYFIFVYRNANRLLRVDFVTVISSKSFYLGLQGFICVRLTEAVSLFFFLYECHCISFSYLIALVRTSKTMLYPSGKSGHPCLVPDFRRGSFCFFTIEHDVTCGLLLY